jgi:hydroxymethylglutaryl-CoA lyase
MDTVEIVEVGPRDGLQNLPAFVPTETKIAFIKALVAAGFKRLEIGSFVSPKAVPQMRDIDEVVTGLGDLGDVRTMALVPNSLGAKRAIAAGITELEFVISMTDSHNMSNVRRPTAASIADLEKLLAEVDPEGKLKMRVGLATSFHCPFEGYTDEDQVLRNCERILSIRPGFEMGIADTTGMAIPSHVKRLASRCIAEFGDRASWCYHGHDTAGFGIANVLAAYQAGIRSFDGAAAGLGGCPFAPGATGNIATEDLVYLFARMGVATGIDLDKLLEAAEIAAHLPMAVTGGHVRSIPRARLFGAGGACAVAA